MTTTLLTHAHLMALLAEGPVTNITGREEVVHPDGVINIESYVSAVPSIDLGGYSVHSELQIEVVYQTHGGSFDLVHIITSRKNVYLVVVVDNRKDKVHGHLILDLNKEYGLDAANDA